MTVDTGRTRLIQTSGATWRAVRSRSVQILKFQKAVFPVTLPCERAKYSAIVDRPKLQLPNGERIVIWTIVNVEVWDIARAMPRQVLVPPRE